MSEETVHEKLVRLRKTLATYFSEGELLTLCFDLGVDYADIPGATRSDKARELVVYCNNRAGMVERLIKVGLDQRPDIAWDRVSAGPLTLATPKPDLRSIVRKLRMHLEATSTAAWAQESHRDLLEEMLTDRLNADPTLEYERLFYKYHPDMNDDELFQFDQMRAITDGQLQQDNRAMFALLEEYPQLMDAIPELERLWRHLDFWLRKYDNVFIKQPRMCVLYSGVEDKVPFPSDISDYVDGWLASNG